MQEHEAAAHDEPFLTGLRLVNSAIPATGDHLLFANRELNGVDATTSLERCFFLNFGLKKAIFHGRLTHCRFDRTYLRHAAFRATDLTGTSFVGCNLKYASFEGSNLSYVSFENCQLDYDNVLENMPAQPNLRRHLLRSLRLNAAAQGDPEETGLLRLELAAERAELWATFTGANEYFRRKSVREKLRAFRQWCGHQAQKLLWGYGLQIWVLARTACIVIATGALIMWKACLLFAVASQARSLGLAEALYVSITSFTTVGAGDIVPASAGSRVLVGLESLAGAAFLGLLAATAYRKIAR